MEGSGRKGYSSLREHSGSGEQEDSSTTFTWDLVLPVLTTEGLTQPAEAGQLAAEEAEPEH